MDSKPSSGSARTKTFSIWRDTQESPASTQISAQQTSAALSSKGINALAQKSNNLPYRGTKDKIKIQLVVRDTINRVSDTKVSIVDLEAPDVPSTVTSSEISKSPLEYLPHASLEPALSPRNLISQRVKTMLLQQSFAGLGYSESEQSLIAAADALDVRRRLMETEVPLSTGHWDPKIPDRIPCIVRTHSVNEYKPRVITPLRPAADILRRPRDSNAECLTDPLQEYEFESPSCPPPTRSVTPMISLYATVKITNIPWDASTDQIVDFLGKNTRLALYTSVCSPVHFVLDRTSGKTQSDIFIEIMTLGDAERFAQRKTDKSLGARTVTVELVSSKEMLSAIFPRCRNGFWLTAEEIQNVLTHAKTFKSPYTRKCPQRPFENFISILALFPWANKAVFAESQVGLLYMGYTSLVAILQWHIRKGKIPGLDFALMHRLVIAGTNLTNFTVEQKKAVCSAVGFYPAPIAPIPPRSASDYLTSKLMHCAEDEMDESIPLPRRRSVMYHSSQLGGTSVPRIEVSQYIQAPEQVALPNSWPLQDRRTSDPDTALVDKNLSGSPLRIQDTRTFQATRLSVKSIRPSPTTSLKNISGLASATYERATLTDHSPSTRDKWLENARKAGIAVGIPKTASKCLPR